MDRRTGPNSHWLDNYHPGSVTRNGVVCMEYNNEHYNDFEPPSMVRYYVSLCEIVSLCEACYNLLISAFHANFLWDSNYMV